MLIAVTDNGTGMSKETQAQIFEPFFTTKEQGKGTGLGLATVYGIVKQSRGHISVYSEPGHGTTFKVYLPALDKTAPVALPQKAGAAVKGVGTVLLVEDEPALRVLAVASLKKLGYTVLEAGNGLEALAVVEKHPAKIDVVVADIVMPRMGGPELVEKLRAKRDDFAVIFMTGYTEASVLENAKIGSGCRPAQQTILSGSVGRKNQRTSADGGRRLVQEHGRCTFQLAHNTAFQRILLHPI